RRSQEAVLLGVGAVVAVIWRPRESRIPAFLQAQQWWKDHDVDTQLVNPVGERWNAAAARNEAMRIHGEEGRPLVIAEADRHPENLDSLVRAIAACTELSQYVHLPYTEYQVRRIGREKPV